MSLPQTITITNPRYIVEKHPKDGHSIIDTTGKDKPYTIPLPSRYTYEPPRTPAELADSNAFNKSVCESWAYVWNIVEMGYCGACQHKFAEGETRYPAVGFHVHDRTICFNCACSQED
jgi:hypothetical protein